MFIMCLCFVRRFYLQMLGKAKKCQLCGHFRKRRRKVSFYFQCRNIQEFARKQPQKNGKSKTGSMFCEHVRKK